MRQHRGFAPCPGSGTALDTEAERVETMIGVAAAFCTTASYVPQLRKSWQTGETGDLSLMMLVLLAVGLALWLAYGLMRSDYVIMAANGASLAMLAVIIVIKIRGHRT